MLKKSLFQKPENRLETYEKIPVKGEQKQQGPEIPDNMFINCPSCRETLLSADVKENNGVCIKCGNHFKIGVRQRINMLLDEGSFVGMYGDMTSRNLIDFPGYDKKLEEATSKSGEKEAVICGTGKIKGSSAAIFFMNGDFMMGSMGTVVGEKITLIFEYAAANDLPVIGYTISGGARMQEGILSLMQMAKTSGAVMRHGEAGGLYIAVLTNPTTGGVTASFAMEGDIIISEPGALIGFAGPRVIEQTIRQKLPQGFQRAEFMVEKGFVDAIVERKEQREYLSKLLKLHSKEMLV
ncbi:MAG: acetyl-CoA carboxylase, carboxyltransferase subunit beta [Eubacteriales bacterium]|nr:acetyl-CoA carboxylase, carboxyltransferase subunit beta [Eubacteriales bacterium]MDD4391038.1 acetyl-CoA carboxylase, carboxyltransferase subunit beta [Eubacteriales bacterium]